MAFYSKKNNAKSKIATVGGIDGSTNPVTFAVTTGQGALFPTANFKITIDNEIFLCTSRTGDNLTCARAQESTTIAAHSQNADVENRITAGDLSEMELAILTPPRGHLINGKIVPSVASNNLTVAIKTLAGADPSTSDPVYVRIGDTVRMITAALSVTRNAGSNFLNCGSSKLATKEVDFFVYLGYNTTDGVVIGFSRLPTGTEYGDFVYADQTSDLSICVSTTTNATTGDDYEVVGRFAATLSGGAGYTWSVPSFTNKNLIQRPIFNTRWLSFVPVFTVSGGTAPTFASNNSSYNINGNVCRIITRCNNFSGGTAGSGANFLELTLPMPCDTTLIGTDGGCVGISYYINGATTAFTASTIMSATGVGLRQASSTVLPGSGMNDANARFVMLEAQYPIQ